MPIVVTDHVTKLYGIPKKYQHLTIFYFEMLAALGLIIKPCSPKCSAEHDKSPIAFVYLSSD
jgi:hypothetical protein